MMCLSVFFCAPVFVIYKYKKSCRITRMQQPDMFFSEKKISVCDSSLCFLIEDVDLLNVQRDLDLFACFSH